MHVADPGIAISGKVRQDKVTKVSLIGFMISQYVV